MNPFKIRLSGSYLTTDRAELERELRAKIGIPDEQPVEFTEDSIHAGSLNCVTHGWVGKWKL